MILYAQLNDMQISLRGARLDLWIDFSARETGLLLAETLDAKLKRIKRHAENAFVEMWNPENAQKGEAN